MYRASILIIFILGFHSFCEAQQQCGNPRILQEALKFIDPRSNRTLAGKQLVRVYFHIFTDNNGTNAAATESQLRDEFNILVNDYSTSYLFSQKSTTQI